MNTNEASNAALVKIAKLAIGTKEISDSEGSGIQYTFKTEAIAGHALGLAYDHRLKAMGGTPKSFIIWA